MTNPNNAIGTNAAYGGRTSVNAANDDLATYTSAGVLSGFALSPDTGMVLNLGGVSGTRDVAVAEDAGGNRTTINNISGSPISVTIPAAPASQSRIDAVVAYVANPPQGEATTVDNPAACGLIVVSGTASSSPSAPNDSAIRTAITADGAAGSTAYYAILGTVTVASGTTNITSNMISAGVQATPALADGSVTSDKVDFTTLKTNGTTSLPSINITEAGKYLVTAGLNFYNSTASQYGQLNAQVEVDGTLVAGTDYIIQIAPHSSINTYTSASWCVIVDVPANKTVRLRATTQDRITFRKTWMNAVKIG